jgi:hypothetical protein
MCLLSTRERRLSPIEAAVLKGLDRALAVLLLRGRVLS